MHASCLGKQKSLDICIIRIVLILLLNTYENCREKYNDDNDYE